MFSNGQSSSSGPGYDLDFDVGEDVSDIEYSDDDYSDNENDTSDVELGNDSEPEEVLPFQAMGMNFPPPNNNPTNTIQLNYTPSVPGPQLQVIGQGFPSVPGPQLQVIGQGFPPGPQLQVIGQGFPPPPKLQIIGEGFPSGPNSVPVINNQQLLQPPVGQSMNQFQPAPIGSLYTGQFQPQVIGQQNPGQNVLTGQFQNLNIGGQQNPGQFQGTGQQTPVQNPGQPQYNPNFPVMLPGMLSTYQPSPIQATNPVINPIIPGLPGAVSTSGLNKYQKERLAYQQITYPIQSMASGQFHNAPQLEPIPLNGPVIGPNTFQTNVQSGGAPVMNINPVPVTTSSGRKSKKNTPSPAPYIPPSQITGFPVLQPSSIPYDPTRQEPGEGSTEYQRRMGLYSSLMNIRLPNGQTIPPNTADVLSRMRNNVDIQAVGYQAAAMQLLQQYLPINV